jgi:hypothetical protein
LKKQDGLSHIAAAGNDKVVGRAFLEHTPNRSFRIRQVAPSLELILVFSEFNQEEIKQYDSITDYRRGICRRYGGFEEFNQIAANQTSFTALSSAGKVYTWGDARYEACLGRDVTDEKYISLFSA